MVALSGSQNVLAALIPVHPIAYDTGKSLYNSNQRLYLYEK